MGTKKHRICISGQIKQQHEIIFKLSDEQLIEFRKQLNIARTKGDQAIDNFLGENYGDTEPINTEYYEWSAHLVGDKDSVIEHLDH